jgi:hypothetical protein
LIKELILLLEENRGIKFVLLHSGNKRDLPMFKKIVEENDKVIGLYDEIGANFENNLIFFRF